MILAPTTVPLITLTQHLLLGEGLQTIPQTIITLLLLLGLAHLVPLELFTTLQLQQLHLQEVCNVEVHLQFLRYGGQLAHILPNTSTLNRPREFLALILAQCVGILQHEWQFVHLRELLQLLL